MQLAILAGPHAAAVWTACKTLNTIAVAMNKEMVYLNLKTGANWAERDTALLGPQRVDHFLNEYLRWEVPEGLNTRVRQFRVMFYEYAREALHQGSFLEVNDWPANKNRVRAAAASMLHDIGLIVKGREQQRILREKVKALRAEMAVIQEFQYWWSMVKGVSCTDEMADMIGDPYAACLSGAERVAPTLATAEKGLEDLNYAGDAGALQQRINQQEAQIDAQASRLEGDLAFIQSLCHADQEEWATGQRAIAQMDEKMQVLEALASSAMASADRACAAIDYETAGYHAGLAETAYLDGQVQLVGILNDRINLSLWEPPKPIDFEELLASNNETYLILRNMKQEVERANAEKSRLQESAGLAVRQLQPCDGWLVSGEAERNPELGDLIQNYRYRAGRLMAALEALGIPSNELMNYLDDQLVSNESFILEQTERQREGRACLDELHELEDMVRRMDGNLARADVLAGDTRDHAQRARACADALAEDTSADAAAEGDVDPDETDDDWSEVALTSDGEDLSVPGDDESANAAAEGDVDPDETDDDRSEVAVTSDGENLSVPGDDEADEAADEGWEPVGEVRTIDGEPRDVRPGGERAPGPQGRTTVPANDAQTAALIRAAGAAFDACDFALAQQHANGLAAQDPNHPWLAANHGIISDNARRQREALAVLRQAQARLQTSNLQIADVKLVREMIQHAAQTAPNCMVDRINSVLVEVSAGMESARARDRAQAASALGGLISTLTTVATMVQTAPPAVAPPAAGRTSGTRPLPATGVATPPQGGSPPAAGSPCSINVASSPSPEDEIQYWALVEFPAPGNPHVKNYLVLPVVEGHTLNEALASLAAQGAPGRQVGTGSLAQMKSLARQYCPNPAGYIEH